MMDIDTLHIIQPEHLGKLQLNYELEMRNYIPLQGDTSRTRTEFLRRAIRNETDNEMARLRLKSPYTFENDYDEFLALLDDMNIQLQSASCRKDLMMEATNLVHLIWRAKRLQANTAAQIALRVHMMCATDKLWEKFSELVSESTDSDKFDENEMRLFFGNDSIGHSSRSSKSHVESSISNNINSIAVATASSENGNNAFRPHSTHVNGDHIPPSYNTPGARSQLNESRATDQVEPNHTLNSTPVDPESRFRELCQNYEEGNNQMAIIKDMMRCFSELSGNVRDLSGQVAKQVDANKVLNDKLDKSIEELKEQIVNTSTRVNSETTQYNESINALQQNDSNDSDVQIIEPSNTRIGVNNENPNSVRNIVDIQPSKNQIGPITNANHENILLQRDNVIHADGSSMQRASLQVSRPTFNPIDFIAPSIQSILGFQNLQMLNLGEQISINRNELLKIVSSVAQTPNARLLPTTEKHTLGNDEHNSVLPEIPMQSEPRRLTFSSTDTVIDSSEASRSNAPNNEKNGDVPTYVNSGNNYPIPKISKRANSQTSEPFRVRIDTPPISPVQCNQNTQPSQNANREPNSNIVNSQSIPNYIPNSKKPIDSHYYQNNRPYSGYRNDLNALNPLNPPNRQSNLNHNDRSVHDNNNNRHGIGIVNNANAHNEHGSHLSNRDSDYNYSRSHSSNPMHRWNIKFSGSLTAAEANRTTIALKAEDFLQKVKRMMHSEHISREEALEKIEYLLSDSAEDWYKAYSRHIRNWDDFEREFKAEYCREDFEFELFKKINSTVQRENEALNEYVNKMLALIYTLTNPWEDRLIIHTILGNMRAEYSSTIRLLNPATVRQLSEFVRRMDPSKTVPKVESKPYYEQPRVFRFSRGKENQMKFQHKRDVNEVHVTLPSDLHVEEENEESCDTDDELEVYVEENESVPIKNIPNYRKVFPPSVRSKKVDKNQPSDRLFHCFDCGGAGHTALICDSPTGKPFCQLCGKRNVNIRTCGCEKAKAYLDRFSQSKNDHPRPLSNRSSVMGVNNASTSLTQ